MKDLDIARNELEDILKKGITTPNDFIAMAVAGETLRCLGIAQGVKPPMVLTAYYMALQHHRDLAPINLGAHLKRAIEKLQEYAFTPESFRQVLFDGEQLLANITEVLLVALARVRSGIDPAEEGLYLADQALVDMQCLAPRVPELWDAAARASSVLHSDPKFPWVLDYLRPLAQLSSLRTK